jgi:hypothetical protein
MENLHRFLTYRFNTGIMLSGNANRSRLIDCYLS